MDLISDSRILSQHNIQRMILFLIKLKYIVNIPNMNCIGLYVQN